MDSLLPCMAPEMKKKNYNNNLKKATINEPGKSTKTIEIQMKFLCLLWHQIPPGWPDSGQLWPLM